MWETITYRALEGPKSQNLWWLSLPITKLKLREECKGTVLAITEALILLGK